MLIVEGAIFLQVIGLAVYQQGVRVVDPLGIIRFFLCKLLAPF